MVYLLKSANYLKVGSSLNKQTFERRLEFYKTHNPFGYEIVGLVEGGKDLEHLIQIDLVDLH